jgi:hypothetical protein
MWQETATKVTSQSERVQITPNCGQNTTPRGQRTVSPQVAIKRTNKTQYGGADVCSYSFCNRQRSIIHDHRVYLFKLPVSLALKRTRLRLSAVKLRNQICKFALCVHYFVQTSYSLDMRTWITKQYTLRFPAVWKAKSEALNQDYGCPNLCRHLRSTINLLAPELFFF